MPGISDEIITGINHALVGLNDGKALRNALVLPWIVSAVKTFWCFDGADGGVIGQHQHQAHLGVVRFHFFDCLRSHAVEAAVVTHKEIRHAVFRYMALDLRQERRIDIHIGITMADKEARLCHFIIPTFCNMGIISP